MKKILIIAASVVGILIVGFFVLRLMVGITSKTDKTKKTQTSPKTSPTQDLKTFRSSEIMDFSIQIPREYEVTEKFGSVTIVTEEGEIHIGQNGTNFDNLNDFIKNSRNNLEDRIKNRKDLTINDLESAVGFIDEEKTYFIYKEYNVYILSAKVESLYNDLDQIAQSFRYVP
ncbi:hypothetical protein KKB40_03895 [Patescibacteria group bacterium]|nr:hypothetical protein [Patescibacteria group bacterium]